MVFEIAGREAVSLGRVRLISDPEAALEAGQSLPKDVRVEVSSSGGSGGWRPFRSGTGGPDGVTDLSRAPTLARRIVITVTSAWSDGPMRIDAVVFN